MGVVKTILRKYLDGLQQEDLWSDFISQVLFFLRFTVARSTGITPFQAAFGFEPAVPSLVKIDQITNYEVDYSALEEPADFDALAEHFFELRKHLAKQLMQQDAVMIRDYLRRFAQTPYDPKQGDLVLLK